MDLRPPYGAAAQSTFSARDPDMTLSQKLWQMSWGLVLLTT